MKLKHGILSSLVGLSALSAQAATVDVKITNLTNGNYITPMAVVGHPASIQLFNVGEAASPQIAEMAEGGSLAGLVALAGDLDNVNAEAATPEGADAPMPLAPGLTATVTDFDTGAEGDSLSIVGMILPTNDGFAGLNTWTIPSEPGTYMVYLNGYDAGSEVNNELFDNMGGATGTLGMPAQGLVNGGSGGTGLTDTETNMTVHIHPGVIGDDDPTGGVSDINNTVHRWLNPVARAIITVK